MKINNTSRFDNLAGGAGKQSLLKSSLRSLVDLVAISDRKANMLVSINAIIISIVITLGGTQLSSNKGNIEEIAFAAFPILLIVLTCLVSGILAIYAVNPKQIQKHDDEHLGIFLLVRKYKDIDAYLDQMATILKSNELIYKNISTDLHTISSFLIYKNALLRKAYIVFYIGILISVLSFIFTAIAMN